MRRSIFFVLLGLILAGASLAWGQPEREFGGGGFQDRFQEIKRSQLGPALGVNQQTVDRLLAIDARYKPLRRQLVAEMKNDMQRLQQRKDDEETALLTPMQQARYLMYLMSLIKEARSIKSGAGKPGGQGRPGVVGGPGGGMGTPGGMAVPTLRPSEIPVSRPPR